MEIKPHNPANEDCDCPHCTYIIVACTQVKDSAKRVARELQISQKEAVLLMQTNSLLVMGGMIGDALFEGEEVSVEQKVPFPHGTAH